MSAPFPARRAAPAALALAALAAALGAALAPAPAAAQIARAFTARFSANTSGSITLIANTLMTCDGTNNCANAQAGVGGNLNNDNKTMVYVDADGDPATFSSSTATLALPSGAIVLWAGLYWGGVSADPARNTALFAPPGGGYATVTASQLDAMGDVYQGFTDVTASVRSAGNGTYAVANVQSTPGTGNVWAGWSLVIVYRLDSLPPRNLVVADGFGFAGPGNPVTFNVSGFLTPPSGTIQTSAGAVAYDGDLGFTGESFVLNGTTLSDALNPANNVFNSTVTLRGTRFAAKNPDYVNQLGLDADILAANGVLGNGSTSATITLTSASDRYYAGVITFDTDIFLPKFSSASFTKSVTDLNGGAVRPGDILEYTVTARNAGTDNAVQTVIRDTLPANATYVAGSMRVVSGANAGAKSDLAGDDQMDFDAASRTVVARVGTGATATQGGTLSIGQATAIAFRVQVRPPAPTGTVVSNQAALACSGQVMGVAVNAASDADTLAPGDQPTLVTTVSAPIRGTVFEDASYGGGAGRPLAASGGAGRPGARVELYDASGNFTAATATDSSGAYALDGWAPGLYTVRVVNATVRSARPGGGTAGLVPVQTYRTDASTGVAVAVADRVGGESPSRADAAANLAGALLGTLSTATAAPQSLSPVALGTAAVNGVDFGFNFDTIVNTNDAGQGSLRQFIANANALGNAGLSQSGHPAGVETSIFMVSDGAAHPGLRAGLPGLLVSGVARIATLSALPALTDAATAIDGATQTANVGDTNPAALGGGVAGADGVAIPALPAPEVELRDSLGVAIGLDLAGAGETLSDLAITGFGNAAGSDADADVRVGAAAANATLRRLVLGATARVWADPGTALRSGGDHVRALGGDGGTLQACLAGWGGGSGLALTAGSDGWSVTGSLFASNALADPTRGQIVLAGSGGAGIASCALANGAGPGLDAATATGGVTLSELTVTGHGRAAGAVTAGLRLGGAGGTVSRCVLTDNFGAGAQVVAGGSAWTLTRNSIARNGTVAPLAGGAPSGEIGIDLQASGDDPAAGTAPYVTKNDANDADAGGNGLLNFPVIQSAVLVNGQLSIAGWARPGSTIEVFLSDGDPSGFGEGQTYSFTVTEGSAADLDAATSAYGPPVNGLDQGADDTNRFRFTLADPLGIAVGTRLTATATLAGQGTSEFSGAVVVAGGGAVSGTVYADANHDAALSAGESGAGLALWVKLVASGGTSAQQVAAVDPTTGAWSLASVGSGSWTLLLDTSADPADVTVTASPGWLGTQNASGVLPVTMVATDVASQDFGLWHGSRADGVVFRDDGAGGVANDGVAQAGEAPVAGVPVRLAGAACAGGVCDSTVTDGAGAFTLWIPDGANAVSVQETNLARWVSTGAGAGTTGGAYDRGSDAIAFTAASGTTYSGLAFGDVPPNVWVAPGAQSVGPGGAVWYAHTFTAASGGDVSFAAGDAPAPAIAGWSTTLYRDLNCNGRVDAGEPQLAGPIALSQGQSVCVVARTQTPAGAPAGAYDAATLTAGFTYANASPALAAADTLSDVTTVTLANGLVLTKSVDRANAPPGALLTYTIAYANPGPAALSNIVIDDATPAWTTFVSAACATPGAGITGCALAQQPAAGAAGAVRWTLSGALAPGGSGSVSFVVRVQ